MQRRQILQLPFFLAAAGTLGTPGAMAREAIMTVSTYQWDQFIDEAKSLFANVTDKSTLDDELLIHPNYSFCTLGIKGEVRIQNFETVGAVPGYESRQTFKVRKTQDQLLTPGRVNSLTRSRDYIHQLEAGNDYAMGIDIGILHTKDVGFSYLKVSDDTTGAITTAHWNKALTDKVRA